MDRRSFFGMAVGALASQGARVRAREERSLPIQALSVSPNGTSVVAATQADMHILAHPSFHEERRLEAPFDQITRLRFLDSQRLLVAGGVPAESGMVWIGVWPKLDKWQRWEDHKDVVWDADIRGEWLAAASLDRLVTLQRVGSDERVQLAGHARGVTGAAWIHPGRECVTCGSDGSLRLWRRQQGEWKTVLVLNQHRGPIWRLETRPKLPAQGLPQVMTCSGDQTVRLWQPTIGRMVRFVRLKRAVPVTGVWTFDGRWYAVGSDDGVLRWVDPESANIVESVRVSEGRITSVAAAPGRPAVVVGDDLGKVSNAVKSRG